MRGRWSLDGLGVSEAQPLRVNAGRQVGGLGFTRRGSGLLAIGRRKGEEGAPHPVPPLLSAQRTLPSSGPGELPRAVLAPRTRPEGARPSCTLRA